ncbi:MAG: Na+/H+ antiporter NhaC [Anaerovorax sp.]|nr:Na+/H+ antiporter NhaC [Anaerovorax sp.]
MNARKPHMWEALLSFGFLIGVMAIGIAVFEANPHVPMLLGAAFGAIMALRLGFTWKEVEDSMFHGIAQALQAIIILAIIGILIGVWLVAGVVPSMIYYGLLILTPKTFLVATVLICSITSLATGTSWGTAGTIGIALMGVAAGLGIPAPMAAGAVISGAYFGDKMSPLSDTTNLAPAMAGTDVFTHVKFMLKATILAYSIAIAVYIILGMKYGASSSVDLGAIDDIKDGLTRTFTISPFLLIPPLAVIISMAKKIPAIPGIFIGLILGAICAPIFQGANFGDILICGYDGFVSNTGNEAMDSLLTAGGLMGMMYSISLTIFAMMFGGIMEKSGQLEVIVKKLLTFVKRDAGLVALTVCTSIGSNATMPEQYISIVVPGRMYAPAYRARGLHPKTLSNALESGGTVTSALVPWNTCGVFLFGVLGVPTSMYFKWAVFNYSMPIIVILMAYLGGITIARMSKEELAIRDEEDGILNTENKEIRQKNA